MRSLSALILLLAPFALANPGGVTAHIPPKGAIPTGCTPIYDGKFGMEIKTLKEIRVPTSANDPGDPIPIMCLTGTTTLVMELGKAGSSVLTDAKGRTAYIASNRQFQFDGPPQAGAIYTSGFSMCGDGAIAMGGQDFFYQCASGSFYNLYDQSIGGQCEKVKMIIVRLMDCSYADNKAGLVVVQ